MLTYGDVELLPDRRHVRVSDEPFKLGSRAYKLLEVLADANGALVSKDEIMSRVWPDTVVEEANLYVQICAIRKMLGPRADRLGVVPGQGYCLAPESSSQRVLSSVTALSQAATGAPPQSLCTARIFGRDGAVDELMHALSESSLVSVVGPGGVGKTTVAREVARRVESSNAGEVWFVELAKVNVPEFLSATVADVIDNVSIRSGSPLQRIVKRLRDTHAIVVLDNCEHIIEAAAQLAQTILTLAPMCRVMATSREPLRLPGEVVHRLQPLDLPRPTDTNAEVIKSSAVQLFLDRSGSMGGRFASEESSIPIAGAICRRLDGLPLAIELAATRAATLGIREFLEYLDDCLLTLNGGYRTALPQHQTLKAAFEWSYTLLSNSQQRVFRRLSIFPALFDVKAAIRIATEDEQDSTEIMGAVCALLDKSLLVSEMKNGYMRYRLLETGRVYARQKLVDNGEEGAVQQKFVEYVCGQASVSP
ncbi:winged helix-turn-helix domain-containing protein [Paraburkholderia caffeinilytica]|uniref:winged helix-turn-helix domain-containing protein n=1 Tax=Paraburkholderia caffeinilytica TaxID=1761016 RepID=UPI0038BDEAB6